MCRVFGRGCVMLYGLILRVCCICVLLNVCVDCVWRIVWSCMACYCCVCLCLCVIAILVECHRMLCELLCDDVCCCIGFVVFVCLLNVCS